jgi:hypothetical protein
MFWACFLSLVILKIYVHRDITIFLCLFNKNNSWTAKKEIVSLKFGNRFLRIHTTFMDSFQAWNWPKVIKQRTTLEQKLFWVAFTWIEVIHHRQYSRFLSYSNLVRSISLDGAINRNSSLTFFPTSLSAYSH